MALLAEQIVEVALELLDEVGLEGLTTRSLARRLDVQGPSLYHHFRNKQDLLGQMAVAMVERSLRDLRRDVPWDVWLRTLANQTRRMVLDQRDGARLLTASSPTDTMRLETIPWITQPLVQAGFPFETAHRAIGLMASFVIGWTMNEQNATMRRFMSSVTGVDAGFDFAVETIIQGLACRQDIAATVQP